MVPRGSYRRAAIGALLVASVTMPVWMSRATAAPVANSQRTLDVSLPGPFNGCTYLDAGMTPTMNAVLDLVRPSAFLTNANGNLYGAGGAISSAELTSLTPEVVRYTIAPGERWSDGAMFAGADLFSWWQRARSLGSVVSDGYRDIKTLVVAPDGLSVTATFAQPYADWNLLFRDVEALGTSPGCSLADLVQRPSLGPYRVVNATVHRLVLVMNPQWPVATNRFGRIVVTDSSAIPSSKTTKYVSFSLDVNRSQVQALSSHPTILSHIGASSNLEEISFAPSRPFTSRLAVRQALSWSLNRQSLINELWGAVTFSPSSAASALYTQGQAAYPGGSGTGPTNQTTSTTLPPGSTSNGLADCFTCAVAMLKRDGFHRTTQGWFTVRGFTLALVLAVGPSSLDHSVASSVITQWARLGVPVRELNVSSETSAAQASAGNRVDLSVFSRPTITAPSYSARSWSGPSFPDSFPSGWRSDSTTALFRQAISNFNPVAASATWLTLDQAILNLYWVRPLFTTPSLLEWSNTLSGVNPSFSIPGVVDQLPTWSLAGQTAGS